mmetsp:Transcript_33907/g.52015  ORF Transcript_33907/g.52015 Transcript_33907/m.52015 type:complete len:85 (+) Transcript_33907:110-364(+)
MKEILSKLKQADSTLFIAPYKKNMSNSHTFTHGYFSKNASGHEKIFVGMTPKTKGGACFARVLIGHSKSMHEIMEDMSRWLKEK